MVLHFHGHIFTILFCLFPLSTLSFLPFCSCSVISKLALPPHKTSKGRKECPLAPFDKKHNRNGCFKFRPIKSQQKHCHTSTWKDKPNLTLARCGILNQCCCTKKISDKILIWLWKTHTVKQHWYWKSHSGKQKHTLLHRNKVEACFSHSKEAGFYLFLDFQIIFGWDVLLGVLFACFVMTWTPAERWMAVLVFIFWEKCVKKVC